MPKRSNKLLELARMMMKQARILRDAGLPSEAEALARRALSLKADGWAQRVPVPVRINGRR